MTIAAPPLPDSDGVPVGVLPLVARAKAQPGSLAYITTRARTGRPAVEGESDTADGRMPRRAPGAGEQYRFHFDMRQCIG